MSSILEALRELEDERRRTRGDRGDRKVSVSDAPAPTPGSSVLVYPLIGGLAVGALAVGLWVWGVGRDTPGSAATHVEAPAPAPVAAAPEAAAPRTAAPLTAAPLTVAPAAPVTTERARDASPPPGAGPSWLETAEAPQARVSSHAPPAPVMDAPAAAPQPAPATAAVRGAGSIDVESIRFAAAPEQRSVTLRLDGRRVTLRQGERSGGVEVQLIMADGVYLNRGAEVFFAAPAR